MTPVNIRPELRQRLLHCIAAFRRRSIPVILIDSLLEGADVSYCVINERGGGARAAEHLAAYGHRRCAMVSPSDFCDAVQRYEGFCRAAEQFGMAPPVLVDADSELERTLPAAVRAAQVTGLFCYNDALAQRCIRILRSADYSIPAQISVIGFDDSFLAASIEPPLTTLCHPKEELGRCTASALLKLIQDEIPWPFQKIFDVPLIQRATCARCQPLCAAKPE
ncbi:MAG: substrate-binding domain-containing protein [Oscillospiraceae bacterium]